VAEPLGDPRKGQALERSWLAASVSRHFVGYWIGG
jgi:hypothetical protein